MARQGEYIDQSALDDARRALAVALHRVLLVSGRDDVLPALEKFIDEKINANKRNNRF